MIGYPGTFVTGYPAILVAAALRARMKVPHGLQDISILSTKYPHFYALYLLQMQKLFDPGYNAKVIAALPAEKLPHMTVGDFMLAGVTGIRLRTIST